MKETLIEIVKTIDACETARRGTGISPVARVHCNWDGKDETVWFTNGNQPYYRYPEVEKYGRFVSKNSRIAIKMQTNEVGSPFDYSTENKGTQGHHIEIENRSDFQNRTITIAGDNIGPKNYQYRNLKEFLASLRQNEQDIKDVEKEIKKLRQRNDELKKVKGTTVERGQITKSIKKLQEEYRILTQQQEDLKNITIYIRKQGEMRYSLIVDTEQTRIKSQNLYDGTTLIIKGGPGTGKSTTMIHRLAYLTDTFAIQEDEEKKIFNYKLNASQRQQLLDAIKKNRDWMFFSPSQLLREYLAGAMKSEGLANTYAKVWNWKDYCRKIMKENYCLIGEESSKAPFRISYLEGTLFLQDYNVVEELMKFYLHEFQTIPEQLPVLDTEKTIYEWTAIAKGIRQRFEGCENFDLIHFISLFNVLEAVYGADCEKLLKEEKESVSSFSREISALLEKNDNAKRDIDDVLDLASEEDELSDNIWEDEESKIKSRSKRQKAIESWLEEYSYARVNNKTLKSDVNELISEVLLPLLGDLYDAKIQKIGEMMILKQYAQYTRGVKEILLKGIPVIYKKFCAYLIKVQYNGCDLKLLRDIKQRKRGKELHHQEMSLLLGFINTLVRTIKAKTNSNIKHIYVEAYNEVARPIIGIDEATDFSACDIYAMQSLLLQEFNSLTLCGDRMQRLTTYGINDWSELNGIVSKKKEVEIKTSYRQSKKLLEVARKIYADTLGEIPTYKAFMKSNKVPEPLVCVNTDEHFKVDWISKRISEVHRAYGGQLPSIALFVNDRGYIPGFINDLKETEFFTKNAIDVIDGMGDMQTRAEKHICVYPIDVVKGMEFDVVFFHNIDNSSVDTELLKRYIYVGVSRAAFFLAITLSKQNNEITKYFKENKDWFKI